MSGGPEVRPWWACTGDPCTCPKPVPAVAENTRRLAWFTTEELRAEIDRRVRVEAMAAGRQEQR